MPFTRSIAVSVIATIATIGIMAAAVRAAVTTFSGQGTVSFDSIAVGRAGVGGVTFFNGTILNDTKTSGVDNPVAFGDNVRIDGRIFRGGTQGPADGKPLVIDDDLTVTGTLTAGSISGLSTMMSAAGYAKSSEVLNLTVQNASQDITLGLHNDSLNAQRALIVENRNFMRRMNSFLDCTAFLSQYTISLSSSDYIFCWNLHMAGTVIPAPLSVTSSGDIEVQGQSETTIAPTYKDLTPQSAGG